MSNNLISFDEYSKEKDREKENSLKDTKDIDKLKNFLRAKGFVNPDKNDKNDNIVKKDKEKNVFDYSTVLNELDEDTTQPNGQQPQPNNPQGGQQQPSPQPNGNNGGANGQQQQGGSNQPSSQPTQPNGQQQDDEEDDEETSDDSPFATKKDMETWLDSGYIQNNTRMVPAVGGIPTHYAFKNNEAITLMSIVNKYNTDKVSRKRGLKYKLLRYDSEHHMIIPVQPKEEKKTKSDFTKIIDQLVNIIDLMQNKGEIPLLKIDFDKLLKDKEEDDKEAEEERIRREEKLKRFRAKMKKISEFLTQRLANKGYTKEKIRKIISDIMYRLAGEDKIELPDEPLNIHLDPSSGDSENDITIPNIDDESNKTKAIEDEKGMLDSLFDDSLKAGYSNSNNIGNDDATISDVIQHNSKILTNYINYRNANNPNISNEKEVRDYHEEKIKELTKAFSADLAEKVYKNINPDIGKDLDIEDLFSQVRDKIYKGVDKDSEGDKWLRDNIFNIVLKAVQERKNQNNNSSNSNNNQNTNEEKEDKLPENKPVESTNLDEEKTKEIETEKQSKRKEKLAVNDLSNILLNKDNMIESLKNLRSLKSVKKIIDNINEKKPKLKHLKTYRAKLKGILSKNKEYNIDKELLDYLIDKLNIKISDSENKMYTTIEEMKKYLKNNYKV